MASIQNGTFYATINVQWSNGINYTAIENQKDSGTNYVVTISTGLGGSIWRTNTQKNTSILLRIPYNVNHAISVTPVNCVGTGSPTELLGGIIAGI